MESDRLLKAESIFNDLVGEAADVRAARLETRCAGDAELRRLVEQMLANDHSGMGGFLVQPVYLRGEERLAREETPPSSIGGYEIVRKIAEGGMGVVYEARQANPRRTVALKVLRSALPSAEMLVRFQHEAHILAQFRHPGIAHIYEANTAEIELARGITARLPYFAMELVEGQPLRAFAEDRRLGLRERLELMVQLCGAVQHAHEKGVIHRDLKSDNVLVDATG